MHNVHVGYAKKSAELKIKADCQRTFGPSEGSPACGKLAVYSGKHYFDKMWAVLKPSVVLALFTSVRWRLSVTTVSSVNARSTPLIFGCTT